jgi:hypothetical protein
MKNIFVLPTDKPSKLHLIEDTFKITEKYKNSVCDTEVNIYITSDEEIKEGDYVTNGKYVSQAINEWWTKFYIGNPELKADYWKIILTTDQDLIKGGIQEIDDEFLEWFVKNPSKYDESDMDDLITDELDFCEEHGFEKNEYGNFIYISKNGDSSINLAYVLEDYKQWLMKLILKLQ